jgi:hypothetical protein
MIYTKITTANLSNHPLPFIPAVPAKMCDSLQKKWLEWFYDDWIKYMIVGLGHLGGSAVRVRWLGAVYCTWLDQAHDSLIRSNHMMVL